MGWSIRVARVAGTDVKVHVTFLLLLAWVWFTHYRVGGTEAAWQGVLFIVLLFTCVVLHDFGHAFAARLYGIRTPTSPCCPSAASRVSSACPTSLSRSWLWRWPGPPSTSS